jgi:predicted glycogen debranching enzyme
VISLGPDICQHLEAGLTREWLVTNGLGGFASGTVAGANTRRYHGLLIASLRPPVQRMVLLAALEEWVLIDGQEPVSIATQEYWDGTVFPDGYRRLEQVRLEGMLPIFRWSVGGSVIEKRIWMEEKQNRTAVSYRLVRGRPVGLRIRPLFAHRDYHQHRRGVAPVAVDDITGGWRISANGVTSYLSAAPQPSLRSAPAWYWRVLHRVERERGLDDEEDLFCPGSLEVALAPGKPVTLITGTEPLPEGWSPAASLRAAQARQRDALTAAGFETPGKGLAPRLVLAAEQFRVLRHPDQRTIIAGYHWFADWGRDTMISLRGLTLMAGKPEEARQILATFISYLDQGMLPNAFHDPGEETEYNTIDATLWLFQALQAYGEATRDWDFVLAQLPALDEVIDWHVRGTRYGIRMDPGDGLLSGGAPGVGLTWMDAKDLDWVVTPRHGKAVEINALWFNALRLMADWHRRAESDPVRYLEMSEKTARSARASFWGAEGGYLYDVVDGPEGDDRSLRPNQVFALGLVYPLFTGQRAKSALQVVTTKLLTPYGLRTLSPDDPRYLHSYRGDHRMRDGAYHMGIVWPWLLGPYLDAHYRIHRDREAVRRVLKPFEKHLSEAGLGSVSEIFEAEPPYRPVGAIAQAWSVAELLRHAISLEKAN